MSTDSKAHTHSPHLPKVIDTTPHVSISFRKAKQPGHKLTTNDIKDLVWDGIVKEVRRGNPRVLVPLAESMGMMKPAPEPSKLLDNAVINLLYPAPVNPVPVTVNDGGGGEVTGQAIDNTGDAGPSDPSLAASHNAGPSAADHPSSHKAGGASSDSTDSHTNFSRLGLTPPESIGYAPGNFPSGNIIRDTEEDDEREGWDGG